ncbi:MAG: hypothetical protein GXP62_00055, partial [Oligoflexia bacterium]|nr:hypothetical protein [Oligoflexia bacterium]
SLLPVLLSQAELCLADGRLREAHQRAIDVRPQAETRLDSAERSRLASTLWSLQGQAALRMGEFTSSQDAWTRALNEAKAMGDPVALARARGGVGLVLAARGEEQAALQRLGRALETLPAGDPMWAPVGHALARCCLSVGQVDTATQTWRRVLEVAEATGSERTAARAQAGLVLCAMATASPEAAMASLARVASRLRVLEEGPSLLPVLLSQAELCLADGRLREAHQRAIESDRVAQVSDHLLARIRSLGLAASALLALADVAEARQIANEAADLAHSRASGTPPALLLAVLPVARALLALNCDDMARSILPPLPGEDVLTGAPQRPSSPDRNGAHTRLLAVWALALAHQAPDKSATLAWAALDTTLSTPPHVAARVSLDAVSALSITNDPGLALAIERAHALVPRTGTRLLELECARLTARGGAPDSVGPAKQRASALAALLDHELGAQGRFARRWSV